MQVGCCSREVQRANPRGGKDVGEDDGRQRDGGESDGFGDFRASGLLGLGGLGDLRCSAGRKKVSSGVKGRVQVVPRGFAALYWTEPN